MNYLMIETNFNRKFFTYEKNLPMLIDFAKTFNAEISIVQLKETTNILELKELAPALCSPDYVIPQINYEVIETKHDPNKRKNAEKMRKYIKDLFLKSEIVCLKELKEKFNDFTTSTIYNNLKKVMNDIKDVKKIARGKYCCR